MFSIIWTESSTAQMMWMRSEGQLKSYQLIGGDEFNNKKLNDSLWRNSYPWGRNLYCGKEQQYYTDGDNINLVDGNLILEVKKEIINAKAVGYEPDDKELICEGRNMGKNLRTFNYSSGMIFSKQQYKYGFYEIRFRVSEGKGLWPAFWLYAGHENDEIDIFELKGEKNNMLHVDVHCPSGCKNYKTTLGLLKKNWGDYIPCSENWEDNFNVVAIEWTREYVKWYLNGQGIAYWRGTYDHPMNVIANVAIAHDDGPFSPGPDATTEFPAKFEIDYIRIWAPVDNDAQELITDSKNLGESSFGNAIMTKKKKPEFKCKQLKTPVSYLVLSEEASGAYELNVLGSENNMVDVIVKDSKGSVKYQKLNSADQSFNFEAQDSEHHLSIKIGEEEITYKF